MEGSLTRKHLLRLTVGLLALGGVLFTFHFLTGEQGARTVNLAVFRPGEAKPTMVVRRRIPFDTVTDPIAIGDRFYLLGAKKGRCSAAGIKKDPFLIYAFDPAGGELIELPGAGAPAARTDPRLVTTDDGFLLFAGQQSDEDTACEPRDEYFWKILFWSYDTFSLERFYPIDNVLELAMDLGRGPRPLTLQERIIPETYRYRISRQAWERVPALDLLRASDVTEAEALFEPFEVRSGGDSEVAVLVQHVSSKGPDAYLDSTSEKRIAIPFFDGLEEEGIHVQANPPPPVTIGRKLLFYFPEHTISALSAADLNKQFEMERRWLKEMPRDDVLPSYRNRITHTVSPRPGLVFDLDKGSWSPMNSLGAPRPIEYRAFPGAAAAMGDMLVVFTGEAKRPGAMYDHRTDRWTPISRKGAPQTAAMKVGRWGERLVAFESDPGSGDGKPVDRTIYLFHPASNSWSAYPVAPGLSSVQSVSVIADHLLLSSGYGSEFEWLSLKQSIRTQLLIGPEFREYQFATTRNVAMIYSADISDD